jgi:putative ABC transport system ATP-binding protein
VDLITLKDITKTFHLGEVDLQVLKGVSLSVARGEFVTVLGPSGSGKSTLLGVVGGLVRAYEGKVELFGRDLGALGDRELALLRGERVGFVFQAFHLLAHLTVLENVLTPALFARRGGGDLAPRALEVLRKVGLEDRARDTPAQLSGGQRQRVAIARALVRRPEVVLCDEPTGNLDTRTSRDIMGFFRELNKTEGLTIILVTHDLEVARQSDRSIVLVDGEIVVDTPDHALAAEALHKRAALEGDA